jgi:osmotically-inducible protein OsmY
MVAQWMKQRLASIRAGQVDDEMLARQVRRALSDIGPLRTPGLPIQVEVSQGVVTLRGVISTQSLKARALEETRQLPGVKQVQVELRSEQEVESDVAQALAADPRTHQAAFGIRVTAVNDVVALNGRAPASDIAHIAAAIAAGVPGVGLVQNRLRVEPDGHEA